MASAPCDAGWPIEFVTPFANHTVIDTVWITRSKCNFRSYARGRDLLRQKPAAAYDIRGLNIPDAHNPQTGQQRLNIAVVGTGISGLSAAWLLSETHDVTVFERNHRVGGHSNTVSVSDGRNPPLPVDTGFIVYNLQAYPNLTALFAHLDVKTQEAEMSLGISLRDGALEYSGTTLRGLLAQPSNAFSPAFLGMLRDIAKFYREAPATGRDMPDHVTLGSYLSANRYGRAFIEDHLMPMAAAIWSAPAQTMLDYPVSSFVRFCENHGLLLLTGRPVWRTVTGGSVSYVEKLVQRMPGRILTGRGVEKISRAETDCVLVTDTNGETRRFDHVVVACHADEALALLSDADRDEQNLLGSFRYSRNCAVLHSDPSYMPHRKAVWSSWNYIGRRDRLSVTYWMNRLQSLATDTPYFVTLNPDKAPAPSLTHYVETYTHPIFDPAALAAQRQLWSLQGVRRTWYCGAYFGSGFHEDGLQAGLAVAEQLGGRARPWQVPNASGRICVSLRPERVADLNRQEAPA